MSAEQIEQAISVWITSLKSGDVENAKSAKALLDSAGVKLTISEHGVTWRYDNYQSV